MVKRLETSLDRTYHALAHPTRRTMMELLKSDSMRVTDLAKSFDTSLEATSKHVRVLESALLVSRAIRGRDHVLSLEPQALIPARNWIETYGSFWEERMKGLESYLKSHR
jgi:DNA-binding transcriptional ArsR family regulator